jgi:NADH-quinone oxidoreductase subunit A
MGIRYPQLPETVPPSLAGSVPDTGDRRARQLSVVQFGSQQLAKIALIDMAAFFVILLVGFAYVWQRGDLNWVRAYRSEAAAGASATQAAAEPQRE